MKISVYFSGTSYEQQDETSDLGEIEEIIQHELAHNDDDEDLNDPQPILSIFKKLFHDPKSDAKPIVRFFKRALKKRRRK